jgi:hypothetical protein
MSPSLRPNCYDLMVLDQNFAMLRPREHSAQIPAEDREILERAFKGEHELVNTIVAMNAMAACPAVIVPIKLAPASVMGALGLQEHIAALREHIEPSIRVLGVLGTFYKEIGSMTRDVLAKLRALFGEQLFRTVIHASDSVERSAGKGAPIYLLEPQRREAIEYGRLADEVLERGSRDLVNAVPSRDRSAT